MSFCTYMIYKHVKRHLDKRKKLKNGEVGCTSPQGSSEIAASPYSSVLGDDAAAAKGMELLMFDFGFIAKATKDFSNSNKLGEGGFGPVYKGKLPDGEEIAVKRLSKMSGQGMGEFKNEVLLISKLQHRNLVKLLGCCIHGEERLLFYEFLPNKSLDFFLFDPTKSGLLDWKRRFNIIEGVARGLLYLHRDSRLRIIHRDLKPSNILLDEQFNPKVSDFGMARIFQGNQDPCCTQRVVGTVGYISPEYALEGIFSEKSDVFSFGVLLLEILSGRRNNTIHDQENFVNLLGYAWMLWRENQILSLMDPTLAGCFPSAEALRCCKVGLMCVQEYAEDRPTMASVVMLLGGDAMDFPDPKPSAYFGRRQRHDDSSWSGAADSSANCLTLTQLDCR